MCVLPCREELPTIYKCPYQGCTAVYRGADGMKVSGALPRGQGLLFVWPTGRAQVPVEPGVGLFPGLHGSLGG